MKNDRLRLSSVRAILAKAEVEAAKKRVGKDILIEYLETHTSADTAYPCYNIESCRIARVLNTATPQNFIEALLPAFSLETMELCLYEKKLRLAAGKGYYRREDIGHLFGEYPNGATLNKNYACRLVVLLEKFKFAEEKTEHPWLETQPYTTLNENFIETIREAARAQKSSQAL